MRTLLILSQKIADKFAMVEICDHDFAEQIFFEACFAVTCGRLIRLQICLIDLPKVKPRLKESNTEFIYILIVQGKRLYPRKLPFPNFDGLGLLRVTAHHAKFLRSESQLALVGLLSSHSCDRSDLDEARAK